MTATSEPKASLAELNRIFWDANADSFFEQDWLKVFSEQLTRFLRTQAPNLALRPRDPANPVRLLDYACAQGGASWALAPYVDEILGIDIAPAMAARFNDCAARLGYDSSQARAVAGDLATNGSLAAPASFDVVVVSFALHHFDEPEAMLGRLAERVRLGGVLVAVEGVDVEEETAADGEKHEVLETTNGMVFDEGLFRGWFEGAGCPEGFVYIVNEEVSVIPKECCGKKGGLKRKMVIAAAVRGSS